MLAALDRADAVHEAHLLSHRPHRTPSQRISFSRSSEAHIESEAVQTVRTVEEGAYLLELAIGHADADLPPRVDLLEGDGRLKTNVQLQVLQFT